MLNKCCIPRKTLDMLGYHCAQHGNKYRVSPCDPMCWAPYKELYQQVRERPPQEGKTATSPHGSTCVDIEMYEVSPNNAVNVRGATTFSLALKHLFPTASGVFGPRRFRAPSTVRVLMQEYGLDCLSVRKVKTLTQNVTQGKLFKSRVIADVRFGLACHCSAALRFFLSCRIGS